MAIENLMVFTGNANPELARGVADKLGIPLGKANVSKFSDGEVMVEINENVRGKDVFVLQSNAGQPLTPVRVIIFGDQLGPFPDPADLMEPATHGFR